MGRTENPTDRLEASRGHRHWAKEIGPNQPLFRVDHGVRPKNNLTEPALLEMSGYSGGLNGSMQHSSRAHIALKTKAKDAGYSSGEVFVDQVIR
jgi:hypothetical protein